MSSAKSTKRKATGDGARAAKKPAQSTAKKPRKPKGMVEFAEGKILIDLTKKRWRLGKLIGWGGFGALYLASPDTGSAVTDKAEHVAKIEPHANGPLFAELAFYQRVAKPEPIKVWMKSRKLKHLGIPQYIGSGSVENGSAKMRFMIMERFSHDVDKIYIDHHRRFDISTTLMLGLRIVEILEYIHSNEYVHADIKGSNLMMGFAKGKTDQVYLMDYGLAYRFNPNGSHKVYKEDPKRRHDGTVEFTSRDAHNGVAPSRRGDLEILGYVMLQWLCDRLPWEDNLNDKEYVKQQKVKYMDDIPKLMKDCGLHGKAGAVQKFLEYIVNLDYEEEPDYGFICKLFNQGLKKLGITDDGRSVKFKSGGSGVALSVTNGHIDEEEEDGEEVMGRVAAARVRESPQKSRKRPSDERSQKKAKPKASPKKATSRGGRETISEEEKKPRAKRGRKPKMVDMATSPINWK